MTIDISVVLFFAAEITGTIAFALSGTMTGLRYKLDLFGVLLLAVTTALGGGCIRDLLLGRIPPVMFRDYRYLLVAVVTSLLVFLTAYVARGEYWKREELLASMGNVFDAIGLGAFVVVGIEAGIQAGYGDNGFFLVFLGLMTCIGGGILRDLFVQRMPGVLHKHVYALPCILGACLYLFLIRRQVSDVIATPVVMGLIFTIRMLATKFHWNLPRVE